MVTESKRFNCPTIVYSIYYVIHEILKTGLSLMLWCPDQGMDGVKTGAEFEAVEFDLLSEVRPGWSGGFKGC